MSWQVSAVAEGRSFAKKKFIKKKFWSKIVNLRDNDFWYEKNHIPIRASNNSHKFFIPFFHFHLLFSFILFYHSHLFHFHSYYLSNIKIGIKQSVSLSKFIFYVIIHKMTTFYVDRNFSSFLLCFLSLILLTKHLLTLIIWW